MTKKILLAFAVALVLASCDPEEVFSESIEEESTEWVESGYLDDAPIYTEQTILRDGDHIVDVIEYDGHKFLMFRYTAGHGDLEIVEIKD